MTVAEALVELIACGTAGRCGGVDEEGFPLGALLHFKEARAECAQDLGDLVSARFKSEPDVSWFGSVCAGAPDSVGYNVAVMVTLAAERAEQRWSRVFDFELSEGCAPVVEYWYVHDHPRARSLEWEAALATSGGHVFGKAPKRFFRPFFKVEAPLEAPSRYV
jgi:hypothetical protein